VRRVARFEGAISAVNAAQTVDGWVRANGVGENGEGSIDVEFRAQLCPGAFDLESQTLVRSTGRSKAVDITAAFTWSGWVEGRLEWNPVGAASALRLEDE